MKPTQRRSIIILFSLGLLVVLSACRLGANSRLRNNANTQPAEVSTLRQPGWLRLPASLFAR